MKFQKDEVLRRHPNDFSVWLLFNQDAKELAFLTAILLPYGEDVDAANPYFHTVF